MTEPIISSNVSADVITTGDSELPESLQNAIKILPERQQLLISKLFVELGQSHLFEGFSSESPPLQRQFGQQLVDLDDSYSDGGLAGYITNARKLLDDSRRGANPYAGWVPSVPEGEMYTIGSDAWKTAEMQGRKELGYCGFVLVAGGLGERLGYGGIKIGLPTELATETCYLSFYIEYILAVQAKYAPEGKKLPLCIMTSNDTHAKTLELLEKNGYFGMETSQVSLVQQGIGVPAVFDNEARISLCGGKDDGPRKVTTKPHGHGDIHELLYRHNVAKKWLADGIQWLTIFQDTNGLAFNTLPLMLGVSIKSDLIMNSLTVPRQAKQAIGAIVKLTHSTTGELRTINVEYNQLDSMLRSSGHVDGDTNDHTTGFSPYPGNINQLVFKLDPYVVALERTKGLMPEFVNPKYKDDTKTVFKSPTRLECMMQDFPITLKDDEMNRVGFTTVATELCFSPVKNAVEDGVKLQESGIQPATAATGEADQYAATRLFMRSAGIAIDDASTQTYNGIQVTPGPAIVLKPDFITCPGDYFDKFPLPQHIKISTRSTLVVRGSGVVIESLDLDGTLIIDYKGGENVIIRDKVVKNDGWVRVTDENSDNEIIRMRGYRLEKLAQETMTSESG